MNPDGISYLDIGDRIWSGEWQVLLNAYWSPLYSVLLGLALKILKPSSYWEFPVVHLVNFLIYLVALLGCELLLREFSKTRRQENEEVLSESIWLAIGHLLFISAALLLITLAVVTPDLCVAACVFFVAALLLRIRANPDHQANYVLLGITLGLGYLSKSAMFPLSLVVLGVTFVMVRGWRRANRKSLVGGAVFLVIALPFILGLSLSKHRLTFGDSGKLNYAWEVNRIPKYIHWQGEPKGSGTPLHPTRQIFTRPDVFEFATPVAGSYPPWFDASYWYEGVRVKLDLKRQVEVLRTGSLACVTGLVEQGGSVFSILFLLLLLNRRSWSPRRMIQSTWYLILPAVVAILMYSLVVVTTRYVAPFTVLIWLGIFSGLRPGRPKSRQWFDGLAVCLAIVFVYAAYSPPPLSETAHNFLNRTPDPPPAQWRIANGLRQMGLQPGDRVASLGGVLNSYWYRLARTPVVAEAPARQNLIATFWEAEPQVKDQVMRVFAQTGARAVIVEGVPAGQNMDGWQKIADTEAYIYFLRER